MDVPALDAVTLPPPAPEGWRWRELLELSADFSFETDARGRLSFVSPDPVLGWSAAALLGQPGQQLLESGPGNDGFNPFRPAVPFRRRRAWVRRADGQAACLLFSATPLLDGVGQVIGARGIAVELPEREQQEAGAQAALRRCAVMDHMLWRMRRETLPSLVVQAALEALAEAVGAEGALVINTAIEPGEGAAVLHRAGPDADHASLSDAGLVLATGLRLLRDGGLVPASGLAPNARPVLACPCRTRLDARTGLVLWRAAGGRAWDGEHQALVTSVGGILRMALEQEIMQAEAARQTRTDLLTGLLNRRAFLHEVERRIERLDREELPGALMLADLDRFKALNNRLGQAAGDEALRALTTLLLATFRPTDLVARLGGDEFAVWLDGADELLAAERAESLREGLGRELAHLMAGEPQPLTMSIGIAARWPGRGEEIEAVLQRADRIMADVKRDGRGSWRVSWPERA